MRPPTCSTATPCCGGGSIPNASGWLRAVAVVSSEPALPDLDEGEAASIRLALVSGPQTLLLIDERAGRAVAEAFGIRMERPGAMGPAKPPAKPARSAGLIDASLASGSRPHAVRFYVRSPRSL